MTRVHAFVEGETELFFVRDVLAPHLAMSGVFVTSRMVGKRGGDLKIERVVRDLARSIKQDPSARFTTLFDYYGLHSDWNKRPEVRAPGSAEEATRLELHLSDQIRSAVGGELRPATFIPYLQVHEFEALLFTDTQHLGSVLEADPAEFQKIVEVCGGPELINDSLLSAPSRRIKSIAPHFQKTVHGLNCAARTGVAAIRARCPRFAGWLEQLEQLAESA